MPAAPPQLPRVEPSQSTLDAIIGAIRGNLEVDPDGQLMLASTLCTFITSPEDADTRFEEVKRAVQRIIVVRRVDEPESGKVLIGVFVRLNPQVGDVVEGPDEVLWAWNYRQQESKRMESQNAGTNQRREATDTDREPYNGRGHQDSRE